MIIRADIEKTASMF